MNKKYSHCPKTGITIENNNKIHLLEHLKIPSIILLLCDKLYCDNFASIVLATTNSYWNILT